MSTYVHDLAAEWKKDRADPTQQQTYTVSMWCANCRQGVNVSFPKGTPVATRFGFRPRCPNCGCCTLKRNNG